MEIQLVLHVHHINTSLKRDFCSLYLPSTHSLRACVHVRSFVCVQQLWDSVYIGL